MMRVALFSDDQELQILLTTSVGEPAKVHPEFTEAAIHRMLMNEECDIVYLDISSRRQDYEQRMEFSKKIIHSPVFSIVLAEDEQQDLALHLIQLGADGYRRKSSFVRELELLSHARCESLASRRTPPASGRLNRSTSSGKPLIGNSTQMGRVYELVQRVADLDASVLITGESGTGKELVARSIHAAGSRAARPFIAVSCSAIPESLLEAELFGHEKGAFTGTTGTREGYFEQAGAGTLFLDEIGDLTLGAQVKLLRVLQERQFSRLGSSRLIPLQARVLFATHLDLGESVRHKLFRQDLYYRINVIRIQTPPLREHPDDIPELSVHFLRHYAREFQLPVDRISQEAMELLRAYYWPGNVRELENAIQRAVVVASGNTVMQQDLPPQVHRDNVVGIIPFRQDGLLDRYVLDHKIKMASEALRSFRGNKTLAARSLGISRPYLYRLIRLGDLDQQTDLEQEQEQVQLQ